MKKKLLYVGTILLAAATAVIAADSISGKWVVEQEGRDGTPRKTTIELKVDGAKLTGTMTGMIMGGRGPGGGGPPGGGDPGGGGPPGGGPPGGFGGGPGGNPEPQAISKGKVDSNKATWEVTRETPMGDLTQKFEGVVSGSNMKIKVTMPSFDGGEPRVIEVTAKKQ